MEYWSVEKKDFKPLSITPILQYSNILFWLIEPSFYYFTIPLYQIASKPLTGCDLQIRLYLVDNMIGARFKGQRLPPIDTVYHEETAYVRQHDTA
jgi:hypothetical protein